MRFALKLLLAAVAITSTAAWPWMSQENPDLAFSHDIAMTAGSRQAKLQTLQSLLQGSQYAQLPSWAGKGVSHPLQLAAFALEKMDATFDDAQDTLPDGRAKRIHPLGATAPIKFVPVESQYSFTGLFEGADSCVARLSLAADPSAIGFAPGMAMKCFRDGADVPSGNIISMFSVDGQGQNHNFFLNTFTNIIPTPTSVATRILEDVIFKRASNCPGWISMHQFSQINQEGQAAATPKWPEKIFMVPGDIQFSATNSTDFRYVLETIPVGSKIWDVEAALYATSMERFKIGEIYTTDVFIASDYSDNTLFFQHDRGENDRNCGTEPIPN